MYKSAIPAYDHTGNVNRLLGSSNSLIGDVVHHILEQAEAWPRFINDPIELVQRGTLQDILMHFSS